MFKEENQDTPPHDEHFGVGSFMYWPEGRYIVVQNGEKTVQLMNTHTLRLVHPTVKVSDINHFTKSEVNQLHDAINDQTTFSDYSFETERGRIVSGKK